MTIESALAVLGEKLSGFFIAILFAFAVLFGLTGCNSLQPNAFPQEFGQAAKQVATALTTQSQWKDITANVDGQVINPGVRGEAGLVYFVEGRLVGVSGQVGLRGAGTGTGTADPAREEVLRKLAEHPDLIDKVLKLLDNKVDPPIPLFVGSHPPQLNDDQVLAGKLAAIIRDKKARGDWSCFEDENTSEEVLAALRAYMKVH